MTSNQIAYAKMREEKRHNLVTEGQNVRDLANKERQTEIQSRSQSEGARHNLATERQNWWMGMETQRHNMFGEAQDRAKTRSQVQLQNTQGQALLRQTAVAERDAASRELQSLASYRQSTAALQSANIAGNQLAESIRHNIVGETEAQRHNVAMETQQAANLGEEHRSNIVSELNTQLRNQEEKRSNLAREQETARHNVSSENLESHRLTVTRRQNDQRYELDKARAILDAVQTAVKLTPLAVSILGG